MMTWIATLAAAQPAAAQQWAHGGWWWAPFALLFWGGLAAVVAYLIVHVRPLHWQHQQSGVDRARDILAERLARGEISPEEYYERLSALS